MKIAIIGQGAMGRGMARRLASTGVDVRVWNRSPERIAPEFLDGGRVSNTPGDAAAECDVVLSMVANDAALEAVVAGPEGIAAGLTPEALHVSMSTVSPETTSRIADLHEMRGQAFVAAPVFGGPAVAEAGKLAVVLAGPSGALARARAAIGPLARAMFAVGAEPQSASVVKLCGNIMLFANIEALGEVMSLGETFGVARDALLEVLLGTAFDSPMLRTFGPAVATRRSRPASFQAGLASKDLKLAIAAATSRDLVLPLAAIIDPRLEALVRTAGYDVDVAMLAA